MSKLMYIKNYNNYFNRIVKKETTFNNYTTITLTDRNFNPNDDVTTERIENWHETWTPDYMVILDDNNAVLSRWFVMEFVRTRQGQYKVQLRRDLVADFRDTIINAPMIVDRAWISDSNNPLLFNSEGFSFNQIKQNEILLKDKTWSPWYILYFNRNVTDKQGSFSTADIPYDVAISVDIDDASSPYAPGSYKYIDNQAYKINYNGYPIWLIPPTGSYYARFNMLNGELVKGFMDSGNYHNYRWFYDNPSKVTYANDDWVASKFRTVFDSSIKSTLDSNLQSTYIGDFLSTAKYNTLVEGKSSLVVKTSVEGVNKYYQVTISSSEMTDVKYHTSGSYYSYVVGLIDSIGGLYHNEIDGRTLETECKIHNFKITATELNTSGTVNWKLDFANHVKCEDAPYRIVAIPKYSIGFNVNYRINNDNIPTADQFICPQNINDALVNDIITQYGTGGSELVDIQLLPYFPYNNKVKTIDNDLGDDMVSTMDLDTPNSLLDKGQAETGTYAGWNARQFQIFGTKETTTCACIFYVDNATFSFDIAQSIAIPNRDSSAYLNKKLSNELDLYRLVSPNYNGVFEYSNAKNDGTAKFNVDMTLRPFNPYIHINPVFKGLYGANFKDSRGLICQGDFSLPLINDAWKTYELQNKNYLNVFNRQMEHMDFTQYQERVNAYANLFVGSAQGISTGALGGAMVGGGLGAAIGAGVGAVGSIGGGIADAIMLEKRQAEDRAFAIDNFNYQLGNIKALPTTVTKVTCLTANNKLWPFIEVYSASETEQNILKNKINYTSMNVNAIGTISDYLQSNKSFVSGKLIRLEELGLAYHEAIEIYQELEKGVYI